LANFHTTTSPEAPGPADFTMGSILDEKSLDKAFEGRPDLQVAVRNAAAG